MAKLNEDIVVIKVSKLLRDTDEEAPILDDQIIDQLEQVIGELVPGSLVEIARVDGEIKESEMAWLNNISNVLEVDAPDV